jgi:hypothetical protein
MKETIRLADGFNGDTALFYREPIAVDSDLVKLQSAEVGKEYLIRWARAADLE